MSAMGNGVTFQYFTYFLNPLDQQALFKDGRDKNDIFRDLLKEGKFEYEGRGVKLALVLVYEKDNYFICKLGKKATIKRHLPPEQNFEETLEESWPYCMVIINTNPNHGTGQKIAFELKTNIFSSPHEQLKHFEDAVNVSIASNGYSLAINPVTEEREFWNTVSQYEDKIEKLTLTFNSPNLFNIKNSLNDELKGLEKEYGSTKIAIELENPAGKLHVPHTDLTDQGIDYITRGGGEYELRVKGMKKIIKSKEGTVTKTFDDLDITLKGDNQQALFDLLGKIFE